ncbi:transcription termination factor MTERF8, chloroplastic-like [Rutidosis leptorrhynchoides]|uniref:transcription termination factor MTERF8, chloroplastic-like n=1 Tax=Rutidosis leptorrhynchoides TaxID=125765 RepID=UPI003A99D027
MRFFPFKNFLTEFPKRFLSTSALQESSSSSSLAVQFLINSCGLSSKSALSTSRKLKLDENKLENPRSVIQILKSNGFDETHITKLVQKFPAVLGCRVESNLKPKLEYFAQNGITGTALVDCVVAKPRILHKSLRDSIKPMFELLKEIDSSNDFIIRVLKRNQWIFSSRDKNFKQNIDFLTKRELPARQIARVFMCPTTVAHKHESFIRNFNAVNDLGLDIKSPGYIYALAVFSSMNEATLKKKFQVFKSLGWTQEGILSMLKKHPFCLGLSEERIRECMDYFVKVLKLKPEYVIARPGIFYHSLDKIGRRYNILKVLESNKLVKLDKFLSYLTVSEERFRSFMSQFEEKVPGLPKLYASTAKLDK